MAREFVLKAYLKIHPNIRAAFDKAPVTDSWVRQIGQATYPDLAYCHYQVELTNAEAELRKLGITPIPFVPAEPPRGPQAHSDRYHALRQIQIMAHADYQPAIGMVVAIHRDGLMELSKLEAGFLRLRLKRLGDGDPRLSTEIAELWPKLDYFERTLVEESASMGCLLIEGLMHGRDCTETAHQHYEAIGRRNSAGRRTNP